MKNFITIMFALFAIIVLPSIASAQPAPPHTTSGAHYVIEQCYTVLFPYPHSKREYVRVRRNYTPAPPPPHRMGQPPMGPRPGHHPPPPGGHNHNHGPRR